jgi:hypothetical protein
MLDSSTHSTGAHIPLCAPLGWACQNSINQPRPPGALPKRSLATPNPTWRIRRSLRSLPPEFPCPRPLKPGSATRWSMGIRHFAKGPLKFTPARLSDSSSSLDISKCDHLRRGENLQFNQFPIMTYVSERRLNPQMIEFRYLEEMRLGGPVCCTNRGLREVTSHRPTRTESYLAEK